MHTHTAANRDVARKMNLADPQKVVLDQKTGHIWTGDVTLVPVKGEHSYLCYAEHSWDVVGSVTKMESGLWAGFRYGECVSLRPTARDAALDLSNATKH